MFALRDRDEDGSMLLYQTSELDIAILKGLDHALDNDEIYEVLGRKWRIVSLEIIIPDVGQVGVNCTACEIT